MERDDNIIVEELKKALANYLESDKSYIESLQKELAECVRAGAGACPSCGILPEGIRQEALLDGKPVILYEIACPSCTARRSKGAAREAAIENWNSGKYMNSEGLIVKESKGART